MPRIDPHQLLRCLSVLLSPNGGIKSRDEVQRMAEKNLMAKYSKKLVSKCIYIQILKCTEPELLGQFMGAGGWHSIHMWLTEGLCTKNLPLVRELLELMLLCPIDVERLKTNNIPKLVKELSRDNSNLTIRALASNLVQRWLKSVKCEPVDQITADDIPRIVAEGIREIENASAAKAESNDELKENINKSPKNPEITKDQNGVYENIKEVEKTKNIDLDAEIDNDSLPVLKITLKDGKQVISKVEELDKKPDEERDKIKKEKTTSPKSTSRHKDSSKSHGSGDKHKIKSSSSSSSHKSSSNKHKDDKEHKKTKESHSSSKSKNPEKHSSSSNDRRKDDKHKSSSSKDDKIKSSSSSKDKKSSSSNKDKHDRSKDSIEKEQTPSIHKLGKIPKISDNLKKEPPSISIEVRKPNDPSRPKTVKTFHSKFRSHGLEEEAKPPPSRAAVLKKPAPVITAPVPVPKRLSPVHNDVPPEKKIKLIEPIEKPGSIKLIPPKPKPMLLESDMFMDALNASATNKKEPKKRKRRTSGSKDGNPSGDSSPPSTPSVTSPTQNKSTPLRFYQDTLETEEKEEKKDKSSESSNSEIQDKEKDPKESENSGEKLENQNEVRIINGLRGVLCYHKKKGPKKSIKWKPDTELEEIQYFELDETERVNVTKNFMDMKHLERVHEREAFQKARNLLNDDLMEAKTAWRPLIPIDCGGKIAVDYGKNSKEKEIQAARQKGILQSLYFHKSMIPDSAGEPDLETHQFNEPAIIPLDDVTGNQDNISDFRNIPWPEPKGNMPVSSNQMNNQHMFNPSVNQFPPAFPPSQFAASGFQNTGPTMIAGPEWQNGLPPNMMPPNMVPPVMSVGSLGGPMPPGAMPPGAIPPGAMPPGTLPPGAMPPGMMMGPEMFPPQIFPNSMPPESYNMMDQSANLFPPDFAGSSLPENAYSYLNRGGMRSRGPWRGKATPNNWDRGRGSHSRGGRGKPVCIYYQKKGSCRQGDKCAYLHQGANFPY